MRKISVIGGGLIGRAWAIVFSRADYSVAIFDPVSNAAAHIVPRIADSLNEMECHSLLGPGEKDQIMERIMVCEHLGQCVQGSAYVQECASEVLTIKQNLFCEIEPLIGNDVILASSTSTFMPSVLFRRCQVRERCLVVHPVNPPHLVPLVELVPSSETTVFTLKQVRQLMQAVGQIPITLKQEIAGFVLNRLQVALVNEAISLVAHGIASMEEVDVAVKYGLSRRWVFMGPFETIDLNAPGGIRDYLERYEELYRLARNFQPMAPFPQELLNTLENERRGVLPIADLESRSGWRDRQLMRVTRFFAQAKKF